MTPRAKLTCPRGLVALAAWFAAAVGAAAGEPLEEAGKLAGEWVNVRAETSRLEERWSSERSLLEATLQGLRERADRLGAKRDHLLAVTATGRQETGELAARASAAREVVGATERRLAELSRRILDLRPRLPPRLSASVDLACRSLERNQLSTGERMQLAMTVLNRCNQFNATVTHGEEVLSLPGADGPAAVEVIYWGLSHGYALDRAGDRAWLGVPGRERWEWEPLPAAAPAAVRRLIAIRLDEENPALVAVPARVDAGGR